MEAQRHLNCSVCLQNHTPSRARVFVVVGEAEGDPAVMGFCYAHAATMSDKFKAMVRRTPDAQFAPARLEPAHREPIPLRPRA